MFQRTKMHTGSSALTAMSQAYMELAVHHVFLLDVRSTCYPINIGLIEYTVLSLPLLAVQAISNVRLTSWQNRIVAEHGMILSWDGYTLRSLYCKYLLELQK